MQWEANMAALSRKVREPIKPDAAGGKAERRLPPPPSWWSSGPDANTSNLVAAEEMGQIGRRRRR